MVDPQKLLEEYIDQLPEDMELKLDEGREKYGDAWVDADPEYMYRRMEEEIYEFRQAVEHDKDEVEAIREVADMVNFGFMFMALKRKEDEDDG